MADNNGAKSGLTGISETQPYKRDFRMRQVSQTLIQKHFSRVVPTNQMNGRFKNYKSVLQNSPSHPCSLFSIFMNMTYFIYLFFFNNILFQLVNSRFTSVFFIAPT